MAFGEGQCEAMRRPQARDDVAKRDGGGGAVWRRRPGEVAGGGGATACRQGCGAPVGQEVAYGGVLVGEVSCSY